MAVKQNLGVGWKQGKYNKSNNKPQTVFLAGCKNLDRSSIVVHTYSQNRNTSLSWHIAILQILTLSCTNYHGTVMLFAIPEAG